MVHRHGGRPGERRTARRFARRAQVRFWVHGVGEPRNAFVHDISTTGVFISTPYPLPRGTEIRIEIRDDDGTSYTVEAVVSRRVWVAPDLRKLGPTGMGARFMPPDEVVSRLRERGTGRVAGAKENDDHFRIVLDDDQQLLKMYARDLELGGLFIPTEVPPALNREIQVDFEFPSSEVFVCSARVVQRIPPGQRGDALHAGMAVVFNDPGAVLERLRPFLQAQVEAGESAPPDGEEQGSAAEQPAGPDAEEPDDAEQGETVALQS